MKPVHAPTQFLPFCGMHIDVTLSLSSFIQLIIHVYNSNAQGVLKIT